MGLVRAANYCSILQTTIIAVEFAGGAVLGSDSRVSAGSVRVGAAPFSSTPTLQFTCLKSVFECLEI